MAKLKLTWSQFLEGGFKMLWPTMDDDQKWKLVAYAKRHLGDETADGVVITWDRIGSAVGTTGKALSEHYRRWNADSGSSAPSDSYRARDIRHAKQIAREEPEAILSDPAVVDNLARAIAKNPNATLRVTDAIEHEDRRRGPVAKPHKAQVPSLDIIEAMVKTKQSLEKVIENANAARRDGYVKPQTLRDFADKLRLYADAITEIADSRGLSDETLEEWLA